MRYLFISGLGFLLGFLVCYLLLRKEPIYIPGDPVPYEVIVEKPVPYEVIKPVFVDRWRIITQYDTIYKIDTVQVLGDYFTAKHYNDTLLDSEDAFIRVEETIYMNAIFDRRLFFQNKRAVTSPNFLAGGFMVSNRNVTTGLLLGREKGVYMLGAGYGPAPYVTAGYFRKF